MESIIHEMENLRYTQVRLGFDSSQMETVCMYIHGNQDIFFSSTVLYLESTSRLVLDKLWSLQELKSVVTQTKPDIVLDCRENCDFCYITDLFILVILDVITYILSGRTFISRQDPFSIIYDLQFIFSIRTPI